MKQVLHLTCWVAAILGLLTLLLHPSLGLLQHGLSTGIGVGLIGAGLCLEARKRSLAAAPEMQAAPVQTRGG